MTGMRNLRESWIKDSLGCGAPGPFSHLESGSAFHRLAVYLHMFWCEKDICPHSCRKTKWRWDFRSKDQLPINHSVLISLDSAFKEKFPDMYLKCQCNILNGTQLAEGSALTKMLIPPPLNIRAQSRGGAGNMSEREKGWEIPSSRHDAAFAIRNSQELQESACPRPTQGGTSQQPHMLLWEAYGAWALCNELWATNRIWETPSHCL